MPFFWCSFMMYHFSERNYSKWLLTLSGGHQVFACRHSYPAFVFGPSVQVYVQDVLREQLNDKVFEVLHQNSGHLYICGGMNMAHDVAATIQKILVSRLGITLTQAEEYLSRLKVNLMFQWGLSCPKMVNYLLSIIIYG